PNLPSPIGRDRAEKLPSSEPSPRAGCACPDPPTGPAAVLSVDQEAAYKTVARAAGRSSAIPCPPKTSEHCPDESPDRSAAPLAGCAGTVPRRRAAAGKPPPATRPVRCAIDDCPLLTSCRARLPSATGRG